MKETQYRKGTPFILKKDFPPFPKGTEFYMDKNSISQELMFRTPDFGVILPNGKKIPSMSVFAGYAYVFDEFGGWQEWLEPKHKLEVESWSSHTINFKGTPLTQKMVDEIVKVVNPDILK